MAGWIIFGDSHVKTIQWAADRGRLDWPAEFIVVGGATAVGLRNPNSKTNAMQIFTRRLIPACDGVPVMHIGEVDCGFVIWWRAQMLGESVRAQLEASIAAHVEFVDRLLEHYPEVVLTAATLPTIRDGMEGEVPNARKDVKASQAARTALTLEYTAALEDAAQARSLPFVDISARLLEDGVVAERFRHPDPKEHHLNPEVVGPMWAEGLNSVSRALDARGAVPVRTPQP